MQSTNIYEQPRVRGHLLSVVAALCSWFLLSTIILVYFLCTDSMSHAVLNFIVVVSLTTSVICWTMKNILELGIFMCSLAISSAFTTLLQFDQLKHILHKIHLASCDKVATGEDCSDTSAGNIIYLIFFFTTFLFDLIFIPLTTYFTAKLWWHRWHMRNVALIAPMLPALGSTSGTQTCEDHEKDYVRIVKIPTRRKILCCCC